MSWPFGTLQMFGYDVIVADPPWSYERWSDTNQSKGAADQYATMETADIAKLPVGHLARGNCLLLLWACGCMLPQALDVLKAWGFTFKSEIIWRKVTKNGKPRMGVGYRVRTLHEPILVATNGAPDHPAFPSLFDGVAREHSRKPDEFYEMVRAKTLGLNRCDLFSRQSHAGFDGWGNEHGKFDNETVDPEQDDLINAVASLEG